MLTERERRELEIIERELRSDPRFARSFARISPHPFRRQVLRPRTVIVFGCLVMIAGIFLGLDGTFVQGLVVVSMGVTWWMWSKQKPPPQGRGRTTSRRQ
jgi:hypothetical protein